MADPEHDSDCESSGSDVDISDAMAKCPPLIMLGQMPLGGGMMALGINYDFTRYALYIIANVVAKRGLDISEAQKNAAVQKMTAAFENENHYLFAQAPHTSIGHVSKTLAAHLTGYNMDDKNVDAKSFIVQLFTKFPSDDGKSAEVRANTLTQALVDIGTSEVREAFEQFAFGVYLTGIERAIMHSYGTIITHEITKWLLDGDNELTILVAKRIVGLGSAKIVANLYVDYSAPNEKQLFFGQAADAAQMSPLARAQQIVTEIYNLVSTRAFDALPSKHDTLEKITRLLPQFGNKLIKYLKRADIQFA